MVFTEELHQLSMVIPLLRDIMLLAIHARLCANNPHIRNLYIMCSVVFVLGDTAEES
jgi:hypothetical protein